MNLFNNLRNMCQLYLRNYCENTNFLFSDFLILKRKTNKIVQDYVSVTDITRYIIHYITSK